MKKVYISGDKHDAAKVAKQIVEALEEYGSIGLADVIDRKRAYNGQPWTQDGERGTIEVTGLTTRDIRDCFILACYDSRPTGVKPPESVEDLPFNDMCIEAIGQNLVCWLERYMGIYPASDEIMKRLKRD